MEQSSSQSYYTNAQQYSDEEEEEKIQFQLHYGMVIGFILSLISCVAICFAIAKRFFCRKKFDRKKSNINWSELEENDVR